MLTTHSMEEADVLCNRIAIVSSGILRCIAPQVRLKSLYGGGYNLQINSIKETHLGMERKIRRRQERKQRERQFQSRQNRTASDVVLHPSQLNPSKA